jgi:translation elongation factor P/translation initiation factor 5A
MKAYDIKKGNVVEHNGTVYQVRDIERSSPQGRGGNVKFRFTMYSVPGGNKFDLSLGGDDELKEVELSRRQATFSYKDGDAFVFMDDEDYTPYTLDADVVGDAGGYVCDGLLCAGHRRPAGRVATAAKRDPGSDRDAAGTQGRYRDQASEAGQAQHRHRDPGAGIHHHRRAGVGEYRDRRVRGTRGLTLAVIPA